jgi:hypothetical protein
LAAVPQAPSPDADDTLAAGFRLGSREKRARSFLLWAIAPDETNAQYLAGANFIPLPAHVWVLSHDQIEAIK